MTERLTRAQRRQIESKTQQKIDLDNLAQLKVMSSKVTPVVIAEESDKEESEKEESDKEESEKEESEKEESAKEESAKEESAEENSEEETSEEESDEESDDEDLDELLNKAQEALARQTPSIQFEDDNVKKSISTKISQMNIGMSVDKELYFKTHTGRSKLIPEAVELLGPGEKASKHATVVLTASKDEDSKKLNKKERQAEREKTTGSAWFDMPKAEMTPEIKRDLQILKMRHILDRKRHYKKMGNRPDPKYFQIGTIIESPTEFFSARLNKKDRKQTIVDELMANDDQKNYYKRKYNEVQERTTSGGKKHFKKLKAQRQWAK